MIREFPYLTSALFPGRGGRAVARPHRQDGTGGVAQDSLGSVADRNRTGLTHPKDDDVGAKLFRRGEDFLKGRSSPNQSVHAVVGVAAFVGDAVQSDDKTVLALQWRGAVPN